MKYQVKIRKVFDTDKPVKALASVTIENKIAIHGVRVVETEKGRFVRRCHDEKENMDTYSDSCSFGYSCYSYSYRSI